jgi:hypothetical protein
MIVQFTDSVAGTPVYINPDFVVSMRPDPEDPLHLRDIRLTYGDELRVHGEHTDVADKLARAQPA